MGRSSPGPGRLALFRSRSLIALGKVDGFVGVLMKRRNGQAWTLEDRAFLRESLLVLARMTPGLALFLMPGGAALLPLYAWLLDRRKNRRSKPAVPPGRG